VTVPPPEPAVVVVQISDTHLMAGGAPAYGIVDTEGALRRAVAHVGALAERLGGIDAVVVSGDIAEDGSADAYARFRAIAADLPAPVHVTPGNHDARAPIRAAFAPDDAGAPDAPLDFAVTVGGLTLLGLDTIVPGAPHGAVTAAQCERLDTLLSAAPERPALLFLHHPPFETGIPAMDAANLREPAALEAVLRRHPQVLLVACGHVHRTTLTQWAGRPAMIAPAPGHAVHLDRRPDAPLRFDLDPGGVLVHCWTPGPTRLGRLTSQVSFIDAGPGPYRFFPETA
jgi:3',5'-cyclic AMP phosphodiesterase CpdA